MLHLEKSDEQMAPLTDVAPYSGWRNRELSRTHRVLFLKG